MGYNSKAKITQQDFVVCSQQHILWLDIAMDQPIIMCILQGRCNLPDVVYDGVQWERTFGVTITQGAVGGIFHQQEWGCTVYAKIQNAQNVRMLESSDGLGLFEKVLQVVACHASLEDFDGGFGFEIDMLTKVDFSKASAAQKPHKTIVPQLLPSTIRHGACPPVCSTQTTLRVRVHIVAIGVSEKLVVSAKSIQSSPQLRPCPCEKVQILSVFSLAMWEVRVIHDLDFVLMTRLSCLTEEGIGTRVTLNLPHWREIRAFPCADESPMLKGHP